MSIECNHIYNVSEKFSSLDITLILMNKVIRATKLESTLLNKLICIVRYFWNN